MDTLVTIGITSSFIYSIFSVIMIITGSNEFIHAMYFESTAFVIYFLKLGRHIDKKSKNKTKMEYFTFLLHIIFNRVFIKPPIIKYKLK